MKLTQTSIKKLITWHPGSGKIYLSEGTGKDMRYFDIQFRHNIQGYFLSMGNSKSIKLTHEQIEIIGDYAVDDF